MKAQVITIGDEILIGQTINTNAAFIGNLLIQNSIKVVKTTVVGDDFDDIVNEFHNAMENFDVVLVTGGLGPTHDDITLSAIVKYFETELTESEDVLEDLMNRFRKLNKPLSSINREQALVPKIATVIRNYNGTAPGTFIEKNGTLFFSMPGVPHEMQSMMREFVLPKIKQRFSESTFIETLVLQTTGIAESTLYEKLNPMEELLDGAKLAFLPSPQGVKLRIMAEESTKQGAEAKVLSVEQKIRSRAGRYIFARGEVDLSEVVGRLLKERGLTIATAESCTGGNLGNVFTNYDGSSTFFERGVISYSNAAKVELLEVDEDMLAEVGAVSAEVADAMAKGVRSLAGTDLGIGITGIMGPGGGTETKPVGLVYIAVCDRERCTVKQFMFGDSRIINKARTTQAALEFIRRFLLNISPDA